MANTLFSTYRQGENRVTSSILAVFERLSIAALTNIFQMILQDNNVQLVEFSNQVKSGKNGTVPDARIKANFDYLFETKIKSGDVEINQIKGHLKTANTNSMLILLTPDESEPEVLSKVADKIKERVFWLNFNNLIEIIDQLSDVSDLVINDKESFLLAELKDFIIKENLLCDDPSDRVLVIPAGRAYPFYNIFDIYACQPNRYFRVSDYLAFYYKGAIQKEVPKILAYCDEINLNNIDLNAIEIINIKKKGVHTSKKPFVFYKQGDFPDYTIIKRLIDLKNKIRSSSVPKIELAISNKVIILSEKKDSKTIQLDKEVVNDITAKENDKILAAFVQNQRYVSLAKLKIASKTSDLI